MCRSTVKVHSTRETSWSKSFDQLKPPSRQLPSSRREVPYDVPLLVPRTFESLRGFASIEGEVSVADLEAHRREQRNFQQRRRRYDQQVNSLRTELAAMRNAAECEAEEIKRRALEEADLIRSSARLSVEGTLGASTMVERNVEIEASMILRFAQTFAVEARAEATKVLDDARAEAEQLLSSARADAGAIPSSCSALVGDKEKLRRGRDALRKRVKYWKSRSTDESHGVEQPGVAQRNWASRTICRIVTELINLFTKRTRTSSLTSKRLICERFWIHRTMKSLQPSSLGCSKLDLSVRTGIKDMRNTLQRVKSSRRTNYLATKHNLILALAGDNVVTKRYQTSLARALGMKRKNFFKGAKARAALDSNETQRFSTGVRKTRSDRLSGAVVAVVEDF
ncbi:hypothetical protein R1sor_004088 [Riccia sorocarpa]|uniref:Uncharacterized protein n=1 Tax=Riccia sorocarpa TaxID=122646 RepID=A0ABD3H7H5_9MARC